MQWEEWLVSREPRCGTLCRSASASVKPTYVLSYRGTGIEHFSASPFNPSTVLVYVRTPQVHCTITVGMLNNVHTSTINPDICTPVLRLTVWC